MEGATVKAVAFVNCGIQIDVTIETYEYTVMAGDYVNVTLTGEGSEELMVENQDGTVKIVEKPEEEETEEEAEEA